MRALGLLVAVLLLTAGGFGVALARVPQHGAVLAVLEPLRAGLGPRVGGAAARERGLAALASPLAFVLLAVGLVLALACLWRRRHAPAPEDLGMDVPALAEPALDRRTTRRVEKQAQRLAKQGHLEEAAELCLGSGLLDRAADLFIEGGALVRAAEIRHDQNRFQEAAELYAQAGRYDAAGTIFASQDEPSRAAECYIAAGRKSVAAEMLEKAGKHRRAGDCYREAGFSRHAAQAYLRAQEWEPAAEALEETILDEGRSSAVLDTKKQRELRRMVVQAAKLYEQAGRLERAEEVLEKGGCPALAAEIALRRERFAKASELFLAAQEPLKAAEALRRLGEEQAAARILGEYHRNRGEDEEAAQYLEQAADFLAAGDLYRKLESYARAGSCYERYGDPLQAAEMFRAGGDPVRAAECFVSGNRFEEAAGCYAEAGDGDRQAEALARAGNLLEAGQIYHGLEQEDEAIKVLQRVDPASPQFPAASALLGQIFRTRGMLSLAVKKLNQAVAGDEMDRENLRVFYTLATVHEANGALQEAVDVYEKILSHDYHFEDVEQRLAAARKKLNQVTSAARGGAAGALPMAARSGRYEILGEIGRGGMGIVYKAKDTVLDRLVAYKVLPDALKENPQALRNFLREAKSAAQLNHPNIVTVYDAGEQDGSYYIAMEFVDGTTIKQVIRKRGAIAPRGVLHVLVQMCEALAYAHEKRIVHRDIKTANTMWTRERKAKIMDFGLAKVVEEVRNHTTLISGTPYYMSPEQTLGKNVDHRTDVYSLGVTLFELATGALPFREGNIPYHHVHTPAPDPREVNAGVPPLIAGIIARCLRKNPAERYQSTREILAEVQAGLASAGIDRRA